MVRRSVRSKPRPSIAFISSLGARIQPVLPEAPNDLEKYTYVDRELPYLTAVMTLGFVAATTSQLWFEVTTGWWLFGVFTFAPVDVLQQ